MSPTTLAAILRLPDVEAETGLSKSHIYRLVAQGRFPRQVDLGGRRCVGWRRADIESWLATRSEALGRAA